MTRRLVTYLVLFATACFSLTAHAEMRNWRLSGGYSFMGELVSHTDSQVVVLRNGTRYNYPLSAFSKEDQEYIAKAPAVSEKPAGQPLPPAMAAQGVIARYTFDTATPEPGASILRAEIKDGILNLDGRYQNSIPPGYRAVFDAPRMDYARFTVAARLKPEREGDVLLVGGTSYRWLKLRWANGRMSLSLGSKFMEVINNVSIREGQWVFLALTFDQSSGEVIVYLNGFKEGKVKLPKDFKHEVVGTEYEQRDKQWTTTDYSSGSTSGGVFKGQLDELIVFDRVLPPDEVSKLSPGNAAPAKSPQSGAVKAAPAQAAATKPSLATSTKNLFFNGNFSEPLLDGAIPGWTTKGAIINDGIDKALRITRDSKLKLGGMAQQVVALPPGIKKVKFSIKVRQGAVPGADYEIDLHALDADKKSLTPDGKPGQLGDLRLALGYAVNKPSKAWKEVRFTSKVPSNAAYISILLFTVKADGELDFKDVVCEYEK